MGRPSWDSEASAALNKVPFFVRGLVRRKVEDRVISRGGSAVTAADFREAEARFKAVMGGKSEDKLKTMLPQDNEPGAEMVVVETCHNELSGCPNVLIDTSTWRRAVEEWLEKNDVSERLRRRLDDEKILYHHKLKVAVSGCPNGCCRPQIADIGFVGTLRPEADPELCTGCGQCQKVCPDRAIAIEDDHPVFDREACLGCLKCSEICPTEAISVSAPRARLLMGGKLGRHPHLADVVDEYADQTEAIERAARVVDYYIEHAESRERFADFWLREPGRKSPSGV